MTRATPTAPAMIVVFDIPDSAGTREDEAAGAVTVCVGDDSPGDVAEIVPGVSLDAGSAAGACATQDEGSVTTSFTLAQKPYFVHLCAGFAAASCVQLFAFPVKYFATELPVSPAFHVYTEEGERAPMAPKPMFDPSNTPPP